MATREDNLAVTRGTRNDSGRLIWLNKRISAMGLRMRFFLGLYRVGSWRSLSFGCNIAGSGMPPQN